MKNFLCTVFLGGIIVCCHGHPWVGGLMCFWAFGTLGNAL